MREIPSQQPSISQQCSFANTADQSKNYRTCSAKKALQIPLLIAISSPALLFANPSGHHVTAGTAEVLHQGNICKIQTSDRAIIQWNEFSNNSGELIHFIQPSKTSAVLNRVIGANPSHLLGELKANGQIFLINPNGIIIGHDAKINCASFAASTLDVLDEDFLNGKELKWEGNSTASIIHYGEIAAQDIDFYSKFFEHEGIIEATHVENKMGRVILVANEGEAKVNGAITALGGTVRVLGKQVKLEDNARIDVSHLQGGGTVLIGGDYQGKNPSIPNSELIYMAPKASILADALDQGCGGKVILWADKQNGFFGKISACGGVSGGDGGFVEVSCPLNLGFFGEVQASSILGAPGQLLLDPTNINITNANSAIVTAIGNPTTWSAAAATVNIAGNTAIVAPTNIQAVLLGGTSVVINTAQPPDGGSAGDITVAANGTIAWTTAATLTLQADQDILINGNIQHSTNPTGGISLIAARDININNPLSTIRVSVGSQNGQTTAQAGRNITLQGGSTGNDVSQLGFYTPNAATASGDILVTCVDLSMICGTAQQTSTQIGHGRIDAASATCGTIGANIQINAAGNILMQNGGNLNSFGVIGHGAQSLTNAATASQDGNITISCGNNLNMSGTLLGVNSSLKIGHAMPAPNNAFSPGPALFSGNIDIQIANDLNMGPRGSTIGHGGEFTLTNLVAAQGDISVCCGGNAFFLSDIGPTRIGHYTTNLGSLTSNLNFSCGGNLRFESLQSGPGPGGNIIGYLDVTRSLTLIGTVNLSVCGDVDFIAASTNGSAMGFGYGSSNTASSSTQVNVVIGGDWNGANVGSFTNCVSIGGDLNVAVGGSWTSSANGSGGNISAGPTHDMRIYAGGSILFDSGGTGLAFGQIPSLSVVSGSVDVRAGGDIAWPTGFPAIAPGPVPGPISFLAAHAFAPGELWSGSGGVIQTVCTQPPQTTFPMNCGFCSSFDTQSPANTPLCGAFSPSASALASVLNLNSATGLTINGQCNSCATGGPVSLSIGAAVTNDIAFANPAGPINIGPFENINVNQDITSTGSVTLTACNNLNVNPFGVGNLADITAAGNITLISDIDDSGTGDVNLVAGNITSTGGNILIDAGFGAGSGTSSVNQTAGNVFANSPNGSVTVQALLNISITDGPVPGAPTVQSNGGGITMVAGNDILIDGAPTTVTSTSGFIDMTAGHDISILENVSSTTGNISTLASNDTYVTSSQVTTSGSILMITGVDMFLTGAFISSTGSHVDLVVDNLFPTPPGIGPGSFNMDAASIINSDTDYIRVYTALQGQNNIDPGAQFINAGVPYFFTPGQLYVDSLNEMWCTYYPDGTLGVPFRIFYKDCLQEITEVAENIVSQFLYMQLNFPFEYPDFLETYYIKYRHPNPTKAFSSYALFDQENYFLRRRSYHFNTLKTIQPTKELPKSRSLTLE